MCASSRLCASPHAARGPPGDSGGAAAITSQCLPARDVPRGFQPSQTPNKARERTRAFSGVSPEESGGLQPTHRAQEALR
eukprot:11714090-Alexandrium_andersonii.AAC.1